MSLIERLGQVASAYGDECPESILEALAQLEAMQAEIERHRDALTKCRELFTEIRLDFSDPRSECREGMAIIDASLSDEMGR